MHRLCDGLKLIITNVDGVNAIASLILDTNALVHKGGMWKPTLWRTKVSFLMLRILLYSQTLEIVRIYIRGATRLPIHFVSINRTLLLEVENSGCKINTNDDDADDSTYYLATLNLG